MSFEILTPSARRLLATASLALSLAVPALSILPPVARAATLEPASGLADRVLPIVGVDTGTALNADGNHETTMADRGKISTALKQWQQAWSHEGSRQQFGDFEQLYVAGEALRSLVLARGFKGWQVAWMNVERIQVAGDSAVSSAIVLRQGDGGYRVLHTWRKENGVWRILNEIV